MEKINEAGILLTTYLRSSTRQSMETQIRERQRILHALEQLSKAGHEAVDQGRANLKGASEEQRKLLRPAKRPVVKPHLRVVEADQQGGKRR
jgi:hypothetical protein